MFLNHPVLCMNTSSITYLFLDTYFLTPMCAEQTHRHTDTHAHTRTHTTRTDRQTDRYCHTQNTYCVHRRNQGQRVLARARTHTHTHTHTSFQGHIPLNQGKRMCIWQHRKSATQAVCAKHGIEHILSIERTHSIQRQRMSIWQHGKRHTPCAKQDVLASPDKEKKKKEKRLYSVSKARRLSVYMYISILKRY